MRLAVVTMFRAGERINFHRETALVKAASLYADSVEVLSFSSLVYTDWGAIPPDEAEMLRNAITTSSGSASGDLPRFTTSNDRVAAESGVNQLLPAIRQNLVTINDRLPRTGDVWAAFIDETIRYLNDPSVVVLLDDVLGLIVEKAIRDGRASPAPASRSAAAEAVIGAGLIARLPAFTEIEMSEVLDLRRDLDGPLVRYRAAVAGLRQSDMNPYDVTREAEVDLLWRQSVAPALLEMEETLRDHGLIRELARSLGADVRAVVSGLPLRASVGVAAGAALELAAAVEAVAATAMAFGPPVLDAFETRRQSRDRVRSSDFYYLYKLNRI